MSTQKWTDEELQKRLKEWDVSRPAGITLTTYPRKNPWVTETFALDCADSIIALTRPQALIVSDWFRTKAQAFMSSRKEQTNERDTHFAGFAEMVAQELKGKELLDIGNHIRPLSNPPIDFDYDGVKRIIARRDYDLVAHTVEYIKPEVYEGSSATWEFATDIPDMIKWPES